MIVRISTEAQYRLDDGLLTQLNDLDNRIVKAAAANNAAKFHRLYGEMLSLVRNNGHVVDHDELVGSDVILPAPDLSFEEAKDLFTGEGWIPD